MARKGAPALYELLGRSRGGKSADGKAVTPVQVPIQPPNKVPNKAPNRVPNNVPNNVPPRSSSGSGVQLPSGSTTGTGKQTPKKPADAGRVRKPIKLPSWGVIGAAFGIVTLILVIQLWSSRGSGDEQPDTAAFIQPSTPPAANRATEAAALAVEVPVASGRRDPARVSETVRPQAGALAAVPAPAPQTQPSVASENRAATPVADSDQPLGPMPRGIDPRQSGLNYFVVASVLEANADKIVQFCRDRGLDAWVVPDHNGRLREITILPGVPKSELEGARAKALKARILKVGLQWKAAGRGNADFSGCYAKLYNG